MRRYDEPIEVRSAEVDGVMGPVAFRWRRRGWRVESIERVWFETADWWSRSEPDLLAESQVWRVVARPDRAGEPGVYELACPVGGDEWQLRAVVD